MLEGKSITKSTNLSKKSENHKFLITETFFCMHELTFKKHSYKLV